MNRLLLFSLLCAPLINAAQTIDSSAIRQVDSLIKVSRAFTDKRDFAKAMEVNAIAEKLSLEKLGKITSSYGSICLNHGRILYSQGNFVDAEKWYLESKRVREEVLGTHHPDYAWSLNNLGILYNDMGNYDKAESMHLEAKAVREKALGKEHPDYVWTLTNLANVYQGMGHYEKAEPFALEAKAIWEKTIGKDNSNYASSLNNLANLYQRMGDYETAEPYALEAEVIYKKTLGEDHPYYAASLNNLGVLYNKYLGNYEKAELYYLGASAIWKKTLGKEHQYNAMILNNLGELYLSMGNYEKAELFLLEAKAIKETTLGEEHPEYAAGLYNLAILYTEMGKYEKAEPLYLEAMRIQENVLGKYNPNYAESINGLANNYSNLGNYDKARTLYLESVTIQEKMFGKDNFYYALSLFNLAALYTDMREYKEAELLFLETRAVLEKVIGKDHPVYAKCLFILAVLYKEMRNYEKAELLFIELANSNQSLISKAIHYMSEGELNNYLHTFLERQIQLLSFAQITTNKESNISQNCFDNSLFYKGFLLNAANQIKRLSLSDPVTTQKFNVLKSYERRLAAEYAKPIAEYDSARVADLEDKANDLEKDLARTVAGYGEVMRQVYWQEVQQKLKVDEAAIEFVHYRYVDKRLKNGSTSTSIDSIMYAVLLLKSADTQPQFIPLFEEKSIDSLLNSKAERKADYVNGLYTLADRGAIAIENPKRSLYEILWKPLEKQLVGINRIFYSPSGLLHRINLDAIPVSDPMGIGSQTLVDKYKLIELNSTRQLVIPNQIKNANNDAVLYGGIQFEQDTNLQKREVLIASRSRGELSFTSVDSTLRGGSWNYLAGTEREVNSIEKIMQTVGLNISTRKGYAATEESFKNIGANNSTSPKILHIATHGYFFPDPKIKDKQSAGKSQTESVFKMSDHPMLRSGLIMAGGNAAWQGKQTLEGSEDGILTAYEISQMNLLNTELVVLSACETGLGDIQGNEGVYGLQRAFKIAGAKYLIMSLWQVPDKQTSLLMTTFYKKWLEEKMTIPNAFHAAQKELRDAGLDPYQWAGFVLIE